MKIRGILFASLFCATAVPMGAASQEEPLPKYIRLLRAPGVEPSPVVLWASGCSGFFHPRAPWHFVERAQHLLSAGYAVAYVDYLAAAGYSSACSGEVTLPDIGKTLVDAVRVLSTRHEVDRNQIVLLGGSLGGGGVLAALSMFSAESPGVAAALVLYPTCRGLRAWTAQIPVWIWFAGGDQITPASDCRGMLDRVSGPVTERTYPGAQHGFDMRGLPTEPEPGEAAIALNPAAAEDVWRRIEDVLMQVNRGS